MSSCIHTIVKYLSQLSDLKETWYVTRATELSCIIFHELINTYKAVMLTCNMGGTTVLL